MELGQILLRLGRGGHSSQHQRQRLHQSLNSSTDEQILQMLHKYAGQQGGADVAELVRLLFLGSPVSEPQGLARRQLVFKIAVGLLQAEELSSRVALEMLGLLLMEVDGFPASFLAELADLYMDAVKSTMPANGKAYELLPKILASLAAKETVSYGVSTMPGTQYKDHVLSTLCASRWQPHCIIHLAAMFGDIPLTSDQLQAVLAKLLRRCKDVDLLELPPLVYQLLLLSVKGQKKLVLQGLTSYINEQDRICKAQQNNTNSDADTLEAISPDALRHMEGTVIYHFSFAIKQDQDLGREFIKFLKANQLADTATMLAPFNVALALSIAQIHRFEEQILDILKNGILKSFKDAASRKASHWIAEIVPASADVTEQILDTVRNSCYGWDHVLQGLVQLAFILMDTYGPRAGPSGKSTESPTGARTPNQQACSLGSEILLAALKASEIVRPVILQQLLNRIVTKGKAPVSHYIGLLKKAVQLAPQSMLESQTRVREALDCLAQLPPASAQGLLEAVQPLMKLNATLKDSLMMVLRKAMFSRQGDARKIALTGYLQILKHFRISESLPASQLSSQASMSASCSQIMVDVHMGTQSIANYEALVCLEILGNLRRCFTQQAEVRLILYEGLYEVLHTNSKLKTAIVDMLSRQWLPYYQRDADVNPPIKLSQCVACQADQSFLTEPLSHLLMSLTHCVLRCQKLMDQAGDIEGEEEDEDEEEEELMETQLQQLRDMLASLTRRMIKSDLEDFELDKSAEFSQATSVGTKNTICAVLVLGVYEVLMEYSFAETDFSVESVEELLQLFGKHQTLAELLREKSGLKAKASSKAERSLVSLKAAQDILSALFCDETPDHQEGLSRLRRQPDFVRFAVAVVMQKLQQLQERGQCDGPRGTQTRKLYQFCCTVSRVFLHKFTQSTLSPSATDKKDKRGQPISSLCLEGLATAVGLVCSRYPDRLVDYLDQIDPDQPAVGSQGRPLTDQEAVHLPIKKFQRFVMDILTAADGGASVKDAVHLCNIISVLSKQLEPHTAEFAQLQSWVSRVCTEATIEDTSLIKLLLTMLFSLTQQSSSKVCLVQEIAEDIHSQLGDMDEEHEVESSTHYSVISQNTAAPCVLLHLTAQIDRLLEETESVLKSMKAVLTSDSNKEGGRLTQREDSGKSVTCRLGVLINTFHELVLSAIPAGPCVDAILKAVVKLYNALTLLCKYYLAVYAQQAGHLSERFQKLIKHQATKLTPQVYAMFTFLHNLQTEHLKGKAKQGKAKQVIRHTRGIPAVIYAIEQLEETLIKLSKKSKVDLMEHVKCSTSRDFRINKSVLEEELSDEESSPSEDEGQSPSPEEDSQPMAKKRKNSSGNGESSSG